MESNLQSLVWSRSGGRWGFTLIELLVVVAIIAILAAIAIPNYLEAQVRAKVAKVVAEFHSLGTAIETYHIDEDTYPMDYFPYSNCFSIPGNYWEMQFLLRVLTTPRAYLSSVPSTDPFNEEGGPGMTGDYMYVNDAEHVWWQSCGRAGGRRYIRQYKTLAFGDRWYYWLLKSYGPDKQVEWWIGEYVYDSSNGTISRGEIFRIGP